MVNWIFWAVVVALGFLAILFFEEKFKHMRTKVIVVGAILLLMFFYFTGSKIVHENNVNLKSFSGWVSAGKLYFSWLGNAFDNTKTIVGNAVKMNWDSNSTG